MITGAFVHTERKQINNEKQNSYLVFALNLFRVGPTPYSSLTLELWYSVETGKVCPSPPYTQSDLQGENFWGEGVTGDVA